MGYDKGHKEFHTLDLNDGWHTLPGYPPGIKEKIIAGELDDKNKRGNRTRLLSFKPGTYTTAPFVHDYWEEVFLVSGDLIVGIDGQAVQSARDLADHLTSSGKRVGEVVTLQVERQGETLEVAVRLTARDETQGGAI